jgi:hypothetical protein
MSIKLTTPQFIERIEKIFGVDSFDYSLLEYKNAHKSVKLICKKCGKVEEKDPSVFYRGYGCLNCRIKRPNPKKITKDIWIERVNKIHNFKYDYSKVKDFLTLLNPVEIICPIHGVFKQTPHIHLYAKSNCPECSIYKGEEEVGIWLNHNNIKYEYQFRVKINDSYHYFDFYLPFKNIIIEYNGLQHYKPIKFFGGEEGYKRLLERDKIKYQYCLDNKITLIIIKYKDNINNILKTLI